MTSRALTVDARLEAAQLVLRSWTIEACREYLRERCPRLKAHADADVDALSEFVGRLPLGIRLLVMLLRNCVGLSLVEALKLLEQQPPGALDKYDQDSQAPREMG